MLLFSLASVPPWPCYFMDPLGRCLVVTYYRFTTTASGSRPSMGISAMTTAMQGNLSTIQEHYWFASFQSALCSSCLHLELYTVATFQVIVSSPCTYLPILSVARFETCTRVISSYQYASRKIKGSNYDTWPLKNMRLWRTRKLICGMYEVWPASWNSAAMHHIVVAEPEHLKGS
jgi:hypothetical protein